MKTRGSTAAKTALSKQPKIRALEAEIEELRLRCRAPPHKETARKGWPAPWEIRERNIRKLEGLKKKLEKLLK